jgi:hypothetical protein
MDGTGLGLHCFAMRASRRPHRGRGPGEACPGEACPGEACPGEACEACPCEACEACPLVGLALMRKRIRARVAFEPL